MKFAEFKLNEKLLQGIAEAGFEKCLPVQENTLPVSLKGHDVAVQSQTGTGKTAAFLITIFQRIVEEKAGKALIIVPTRELAVQIEDEAKLIGKNLKLVIGSFYGGVGYHKQELLIKRNVDIIVGTPGRLIDLNQSGRLDFRIIKMLVIDEADRLFDMGFLPDIRRMLRRMAPAEERQTMLFSATLNDNARYIAGEFMNSPETIEISPQEVTVKKIKQMIYHVGHAEKLSFLLGILKRDKPKNTLIFSNTKNEVARLAKHLELNGYGASYLMGDLPQRKRLNIINDFKEGKIPVLVATDVAARGLHIDDLELVVNYDLPGDAENYVHRIGRTARAGKSGKAITLGCDDYIYNLAAIEEFMGMKIPAGAVEPELFVKSVSSDRDLRESSRKVRDKKGQPRAKDKSRKKARTSPKTQPKARLESKNKGKTAKKSDEMARKKARPAAVRKKNLSRKSENIKKKGTPAGKLPAAPKPSDRMETRLEYYRKKYGENFRVVGETAEPARKSGWLKRTWKKLRTSEKAKK